ncbi:MAG: molybdenum cofactor biosynthesis protein MoaE [Robiginitomaculum sp.]
MINLLKTNFNAGARINAFTKQSGNAGAIASFVGRVRGENGDVDSLYLESYPRVTETSIQEAINAANDRWALIDVLIIHRIGTIKAGAPIVLVCTASEHRRSAFAACDFLMDYLKTEAIFWKKQIGENTAEWVEPRQQDYQDQARWK